MIIITTTTIIIISSSSILASQHPCEVGRTEVINPFQK